MATNTYSEIPYQIDQTDIDIYDWMASRPYTYGFDDETSTTWATFRGTTTLGDDIYVKWGFDLSHIPATAVIDSVSVTAKVYAYVGKDSYLDSAGIELCSGSYSSGVKGSSATVSKRSTIETLTISSSDSGVWTRAELDDLWLVTFLNTTGSGTMTYNPQYRMYGATLTVTYHTDVNYTITTTTTQCSTDPSGSVEVSQGSYTTVNIYPNTGYTINKIYNNGTDVTDDIVQKIDYPQFYTIENDTTSIYSFYNDGEYYIATNSTIITGDSFALSTISMELPLSANYVNVYYINDVSDTSNEFALISNMDESLDSSSSTDSNYYMKTSTISSSETKVSFSDVSSGSHQFDIKYIKNSTVSGVNAVFKFRIEIILSASYSADIYYQYVVENIQNDVTLNCICRTNPSYTINIGASPGGTVSPSTSVTIENGNPFLLKVYPSTNYELAHVLVNSSVVEVDDAGDHYQYEIPIVQNDYNVYTTFTSGDSKFYVNDDGEWVQVVQAYEKVNGVWVEKEYASIGDTFSKYVRKS